MTKETNAYGSLPAVRRTAETAAHLVDHVFPPLPVRQWVLSLPKGLCYFLKANLAAVTAVLQILLRVIRQELVKRSSWLPFPSV